MRMRTYLLILVQAAILFFAVVGPVAAQSASSGGSPTDYGAPAVVTRQSGLEMTKDAPNAASPHGRADTASTAIQHIATPPRGMSKTRVDAVYGMPIRRRAAVGQPPITRWDYPDYRVYFEYDHVLHAVVPDQPEPVAHVEQLE